MTYRKRPRVYPLGELADYEVADHDPDVRGWNVFASDGLEIGAVDELMVDPTAKKVRYLAVDLKRDELHDEDHQVLVPIGMARLRENDRDIVLDAMRTADVQALPHYRRDAFDEAFETDLRERLSADDPGSGSDFYERDLYDDRKFYGSDPTRP